MNKKIITTLAVVLGILAIDQVVKLYIKTHFYLGEEIDVIGQWFKIHFTENYGMAFGFEFGGKSGKILLTAFRLLAVGFIAWYILDLIKKQAHDLFERHQSNGETATRRDAHGQGITAGEDLAVDHNRMPFLCPVVGIVPIAINFGLVALAWRQEIELE